MSQVPQSVRRVDGGRIKGAAAVPSVIEIAVRTQLPNGKISIYNLHGSFVTVPPNMQTLATGLWTSISGAWSTNLATLMMPDTQLLAVWIRNMTATTNPIFIGTGTPVPGTGTGNAMPVSNAIVMTEQVAARGRGLKGRVFLSGWTVAADAGNGIIAGAAQTAVNAYGTAISNAITSAGLTPCVAQVARQAYTGLTGTSHSLRQAGNVAVSAYVCQNLVWDTQRRRNQL